MYYLFYYELYVMYMCALLYYVCVLCVGVGCEDYGAGS